MLPNIIGSFRAWLKVENEEIEIEVKDVRYTKGRKEYFIRSLTNKETEGWVTADSLNFRGLPEWS